MTEILELPNHLMLKHIDALAQDYLETTGRHVCRSCGGDIKFMISVLKNKYKMTNFKLIKPFVIYKLQKGSPKTISNDTMTDELAIEFLQIDPARIAVFSQYPENWEELITPTAPEAAKVDEDCCDDEHEGKPCTDCMEKSLRKLKMKELKEQYPEVPTPFGMKKDELIEAIIQYKLANQ